MKRIMVTIMVVLVSCTITAGVTEASASEKPIIFGMAIDKTNFLSPWDIGSMYAFEFFVDQQNKKGGVNGRPIEIISGDTKSDVTVSPRVAMDLIEQGAVALMITCDYDFGSPAANAASDLKVVSMSSMAGSPKFAAKGAGEYAFSMGFPAPEDGYAAAQSAVNRGWKKAYLLIDQLLEYTKTCGAGFEACFQELGGTIVLKDSFVNSDPSVGTQITKLKNVVDKTDVIMLSSIHPGIVSVIRQIRAAGVNLPIVSGDCLSGDYWLSAVPGVSDIYSMNYGSIHGDDPRETVNQIMAIAEKRTGKTAVASNIMTGYDVAHAFVLAIERAGGKTDGDSMKNAIENFKDEDFLTGKVTFTPDRHACQGRDYYVMQVQDGKRTFLEVLKQNRIPDLKVFLK